MPENSNAVDAYAPVFQTPEKNNLDVNLIRQAQKELHEYQEHFLQLQNRLARTDLSVSARETLTKAMAKFAPRLQEKTERVHAYEIQYGIAAEQLVRAQP